MERLQKEHCSKSSIIPAYMFIDPDFHRLFLTIWDMDYTAWAPEERKGQCQEAQGASNLKSGPGGPVDFYYIYIVSVLVSVSQSHSVLFSSIN